jgi:Tol biopolymer transport system component/DNA-binding winged helix-turn-helix (wHTH) protein
MMPAPTQSPHFLRFGILEVDVRAGEVRKSGVKLKLQEQPFQVLCMLVEHPGEIVTREELRNRLWPADTFVDFDRGLNAAVKRLRDALGDSADSPVFIETLARRGYRFIGTVEIPTATPSARRRRWHWLSTTRNAVISGLTACALALSFLYYSHSVRSRASHPAVTPVVTPVVTNVGAKYTPSLSPDGQHLAFAWNGGTGDHYSIYVKLIGGEESLRLTQQASIDFNPVWSPDGRYIAFCRILKDETGIYVIPALGGAERRMRKTLWDEQDFYEALGAAGRLSWSPDGKLLAFSDRVSGNEPVSSIFLLSLESQEIRRLTSPPRWSDFDPVFSPDGQTLAFARRGTGIYMVSVLRGKEQRLISGGYNWGLAWAPDGRHIVFPDASWPVNAGWLWKISLHGGEPERLQFGQEGIEPMIRGNQLVYVRQMANINVWRRKLSSSHTAGPADRFISSTRMESGPQFSPDGSKITFESTRSGYYEVWVCRSEGSGLIQLTHFKSITGTPRWSPDGQRIAFDSRTPGNADIFVIDSQGGSPRRLTSELSSDVVPSWSRDGRWIFFASDRSGRWEVWKIPSDGGTTVQVTHQGGFAAFESPDGRFLYYAKGLGVPGLWRIPTNGGEEIEVISSLKAGYWGYWAVVENGIYYLDMTTKPGINFFDIATHRTTRVFDLESRPTWGAPGLAISSDKKTILYTQLDALNSDIMLVENFR